MKFHIDTCTTPNNFGKVGFRVVVDIGVVAVELLYNAGNLGYRFTGLKLHTQPILRGYGKQPYLRARRLGWTRQEGNPFSLNTKNNPLVFVADSTGLGATTGNAVAA